MNKTDILSLYPYELSEMIAELGEKKFRAGQIFDWLHNKRVLSFDDMTNIPLSLRTKLDKMFCINRLNVAKILESSIDNTVKYLYGLSDDNHIG